MTPKVKAERLMGEGANTVVLRRSFWIAGGLFLATFLLYLSTLAPSVVTLFDDSLEFQLVTYRLGIAHPTGYPLYTLLGKLFTLVVPFGNVAYRVNLMSAFFGAATVALLYLLIVKIVAKNGGLTFSGQLGGIMGASLFAAGPIFWQQATIAEVYTLNAFFVALLLLLATILPFGENHRGVFWLALVAGLALTHHRTILLLLPALGIYFFLEQKALIWKKSAFVSTAALALLAGLAPLLLYLYLPLRGQVGSLDGAYQNTWAGFWQHVSAGGYGVFIFGNPFAQARDAAFYWNLFTAQFYTLGLGLIGLIYLAGRGPHKILALTGTAFLTYTTFNLFYQVSDIEVFFIPPFLLWAVWSGLGLAFLWRTAGQNTGSGENELTRRYYLALAVRILILAIFGLVMFWLIQTTLPLLRARNTWKVHDYGLDILQQPLPQHAAIVGILGEMTLLRYFQHTENRRPDIETIARDAEADRLATVAQLLAAGKSVYLTRELPGAPERWSLSAVGPLIGVNPRPVTTVPPAAIAVNQPVTPEITLLAYTVSRPPHTGDGPAPVRLTLFWQANGPLSSSLKVSARLLDDTDQVVAVVDAIPVHFAYATPAWRPGEIVADVYDLTLPVEPATDVYRPLLIWYDPAEAAVERGRIELEPIRIE